MAQTTKTSLQLKRVFKTSPEKLWELWTNPEKVKLWHHPPGFSTSEAEADARVGGKYKIGMRSPAGQMDTVFGEFLELDKPRKLVFSWQWESNLEEKSVVTVELNPVSEGTELVLTHEKLSGPESVKAHAEGWDAIIPAIDLLVANNN